MARDVRLNLACDLQRDSFVRYMTRDMAKDMRLDLAQDLAPVYIQPKDERMSAGGGDGGELRTAQ